MFYKDEIFYDGNWKLGKMNGFGFYFDGPKGNSYEGLWVDNQRHGKGLYVHSIEDKDEGCWNEEFRYKGEFANDKKDGIGCLTWSDSSYY